MLLQGGGANNFNNPFIQAATTSTPATGAKFVARVLEKGGLPGIVDTLRDGQPKLQQAYLNIVNIIFSYTGNDEQQNGNHTENNQVLSNFELVLKQSCYLFSEIRILFE